MFYCQEKSTINLSEPVMVCPWCVIVLWVENKIKSLWVLQFYSFFFVQNNAEHKQKFRQE